MYTGNWSNDGRTHDQILSEGGVELSCTITESNRLTGTLFAQQEMTERFAVVEDISGEIEQNELLLIMLMMVGEIVAHYICNLEMIAFM